MNKNQHYSVEEDICNDCFAKTMRVMFCKSCHHKIFYPVDVKCDCCDARADFLDCTNCGIQNEITR